MCEGVDAGDVIQVSRPRNNFHFESGPGRHLFIAGGIGATPILPMCYAAAEIGLDWQLLYMVRSRPLAVFANELASYGARVTVHCDDENGAPELEDWFSRNFSVPSSIYACGPDGLLTAIANLAGRYREVRLRTERFRASEAQPADVDRAFVVETSSGLTVHVPRGQSILDALATAGVRTLSSCREGTCGTCETKVLSGDIDHRDSVLTNDERLAGETMMICVSRCLGTRLVLDL